MDVSAGEWGHYQSEILDFLKLGTADRPPQVIGHVRDCVGTYTGRSSDGPATTVDISEQDGDLFASGLPHLWPRNRLVPVSADTYQVASFPCELRFERDAAGIICRLIARGRELLSGPLDLALTRTCESKE